MEDFDAFCNKEYQYKLFKKKVKKIYQYSSKLRGITFLHYYVALSVVFRPKTNINILVLLAVESLLDIPQVSILI